MPVGVEARSLQRTALSTIAIPQKLTTLVPKHEHEVPVRPHGPTKAAAWIATWVGGFEDWLELREGTKERRLQAIAGALVTKLGLSDHLKSARKSYDLRGQKVRL
jgi:hypothetical protein